MSTRCCAIIDDSCWQVPDFETMVLSPRAADYAVVIPVINEGERIRNQLRAMNQMRIHELADIVIVDGASTDGSLDLPFLRSVQVSALLVKRGPGKLSAQLRCAYAYCMRQGYSGVVTMDGNNKDNPAAIPRFLGKLQSGVHFVQGSRFLRGGRAVNTPVSRFLAIRLVHAPLLSLAAGVRWTDTTNGFRAYSAELLLDRRLQPFRDIFRGYELLTYMSVRSPQLGYVCTEIPVERRYPSAGKTPTKIKGMRGYVSLLGALFAAALGLHNPESSPLAGRSR